PVLAVMDQILQIGLAAFGIYVPAIGKGVDMGRNPLFIGGPDQCFEMLGMTVYAPIAEQSQKMYGFIMFLGICKCLHKGGLLFEAVLGHRLVDLGKVLVHDPAGPKVHMTYLTVAHLPLW